MFSSWLIFIYLHITFLFHPSHTLMSTTRWKHIGPPCFLSSEDVSKPDVVAYAEVALTKPKCAIGEPMGTISNWFQNPHVATIQWKVLDVTTENPDQWVITRYLFWIFTPFRQFQTRSSFIGIRGKCIMQLALVFHRDWPYLTICLTVMTNWNHLIRFSHWVSKRLPSSQMVTVFTAPMCSSYSWPAK